MPGRDDGPETRGDTHGETLEETGAPVDGGLIGADGKAGDPDHEAREGATSGADDDETGPGSSSPLHLLRETLGRSTDVPLE